MSWPIANYMRIDDAKGRLVGVYIIRNQERLEAVRSELPTEFFSHELMDLDIEDDDQLFDFTNNWGAALDPQPFADIMDLSFLIEHYLPSDFVENANGIVQLHEVTEIKRTLHALKDAAHNIFKVMCNELQELPSNAILYYGAAGRQMITQSGSGAWTGGSNILDGSFVSNRRAVGLTSAICNQIIDFIADPAVPWICEARDCERIFKRQRRFQKSHGKVSPVSDSIYCSDRCREREKQRRRREAQATA
ncbi:MAG: hypothetical protein FWD65_04350 [Coriobacteriia bacterium]|nr:hypothetical protein [Coriobacteriia bacterium]